MDQELITEYIEKFQEEINSLVKEKIIFRAQIGILTKTVDKLREEIVVLTEENEKLKKKKPKAEQ